MKKEKIFIYSTTCESKKVYANKIRVYFEKNNYGITDNPKEADYIIFFSCGLTNFAMNNCVDLINKFRKYKGELIVAGCLPDTQGDKFNSIFKGKTIPLRNMEKVDDIFPNNKIKFKNIDDQHRVLKNFSQFGPNKEPMALFKNILNKSEIAKKFYIWIKKVSKYLFGRILPFKLGGTLFQTLHLDTLYPGEDRYYAIMIARGCNFNCSYCAGRKAVGRLKSKPISECVKEFKQGLEEGYEFFILDADDSCSYGQDINSSIIELLDELTKIEGNYEIMLDDTNPYWFYKYIEDFERIVKRGKINFISFAVQSANDRILKLMRRPYTNKMLYEIVTRLKKAYPPLRFGTHIIIGFPTETEKEFNDSFEFFKKFNFYLGEFFSYSEKDGTPSELMKPKVSNKVVKKRMENVFKYLRKSGYLTWNAGMGIHGIRDWK